MSLSSGYFLHNDQSIWNFVFNKNQTSKRVFKQMQSFFNQRCRLDLEFTLKVFTCGGIRR